MTETDRQIAEQFREELRKAHVPVDRFVVFGSRARGDAEQYSDLDVLLVVAGPRESMRRRISHCAWKVGFEHAVLICPVVLTRDEFENSPVRYSNVVEAALEEGIAF